MSSAPTCAHRSAFAVISAPILYSKELNDAEKIIYGHISNLCNEFGYCYATNHYLAELSGKSVAAIKRAIKKLADLGFVEINHLPKGQQDERQITLSQFSKSVEKGGGSKMSHPQLKNELPGGSKMSHRIIKEEYINNNITTTRKESEQAEHPSKSSSSSYKCKVKLQALEDLPISTNQKKKIYRQFDQESILQGLEWLKSVDKRNNLGAALYDAIKHGYKPKMKEKEIVVENRNYAKAKLAKYDHQTIKGYKIEICKNFVEFFAPGGKNHCFDYTKFSFRNELDEFCNKLGIKSDLIEVTLQKLGQRLIL